MNLGYSYNKGKLDADMWSADEIYVVAPKGQKLPGLAEHTLNAMVEHIWELDGGKQWVNRISAYYQSETENAISTSARFAQELGSFSIWDFNSSLMFGDWTVGLFVKNLFNEEGVVGVYKEEYMGTSPEQNYYGNGAKNVIARPRTVGLLVSWDF
jgi:outer membrane receptor protein involved in Fe transport